MVHEEMKYFMSQVEKADCLVSPGQPSPGQGSITNKGLHFALELLQRSTK